MFTSHRHYFAVFICLCLISLNTNGIAKQKGLVGDIDAKTGLYTAIDKSFQVVLPIKGNQRYVISAITDTVTTRGTLISIEPKKNAGSYRLETSYAVASDERTHAFPQASTKTFDWYRRLAVRSYRGELVELISQPFKLNGRQAASVIYKQLSSKKSGPRFHLFYLVDFNDRLAFVWTDIPLEKDDLDLEEKIINGSAEQAKKSIAMLRSLKFDY